MRRAFEEGRQVAELRPAGAMRWIPAAFLTFWLCGWLMGEVAGVGLLIGALGLLRGLHFPWLPRMGNAAAAPALLFALVWTSFWTLGGTLAIRELFRLLLGADRIEYDASEVRRISRIGPFVSSRVFPRDEIRGLMVHRTHLALVTAGGPVALTRLGSRAEQAELKADIERALGLGAPSGPPALPVGWESAVDLEGVPVVRRSPALRQRQAAWVGVVFAGLATCAGLTAHKAMIGSDPRVWVPAAILGTLAVAAGAGAIWLGFGGEAIRLRPGQAEVHRWLGSSKWIQSFAPPSLTLERTTDSDGDDVYRLLMRGPQGTKTVAQALSQPGEPLELGRWMAVKLGCELRLPPELKSRVDAA